MAYGDARVKKWGGNKRMEWVTSKRHMTAEHRLARAVQTLRADVHSSSASSRLNWRLYRFKWTRPFRRKTKSGFCACAMAFQTQSTTGSVTNIPVWSNFCTTMYTPLTAPKWYSLVLKVLWISLIYFTGKVRCCSSDHQYPYLFSYLCSSYQDKRSKPGSRFGNIYDMIYLLTAIGLSPGGSTHLHTNNT